MTLRINHNSSAINAHRNIQNNDRMLTKSLEKLSSGLSVVRAADGPATLIISEHIRSQIKGTEQAIKNSEAGIAMIQTTEANLDESNRILTELRGRAVHAANDAVNDELMLRADQFEVDNLLNALDRISRDAEFGKKKLLDGSNAAIGVTTSTDLEFVYANHKVKESSPEGYEVVITQNATRSFVAGTEDLDEDIIQNGETLRISSGGKSIEYITQENDTAQTVLQHLKEELKQANMDLNVELIGGKRLAVQHNKFGSEHTFQVSSSTDGILSEEGRTFTKAAEGADIKGFINGEAALGRGNVLKAVEGNPTTDSLEVRYSGNIGGDDGSDLPSSGAKVGSVIIYQNSLNFQVGPSANQNLGFSLGSVNTRKLGNGVNNESGFRSLRDIDVTTQQGANDAMRLIEQSIDDLSKVRGDLGAFQRNNLESNVIALRVARENMIASESVLRDADMAEEMANLTRNKLKTNSSMSMLSHAQQSASSVLTLLN